MSESNTVNTALVVGGVVGAAAAMFFGGPPVLAYLGWQATRQGGTFLVLKTVAVYAGLGVGGGAGGAVAGQAIHDAAQPSTAATVAPQEKSQSGGSSDSKEM